MPMVPRVLVRRFAGARIRSLVALVGAAAILGISARVVSSAAPLAGGPAAWTNDLSPITPADWSYERARHLLDRAGFGGTPADVAKLAAMTPRQAVDSLVDFAALTERSETVRRIRHLGSRHGSHFRPAAPKPSASRANMARRSARKSGPKVPSAASSRSSTSSSTACAPTASKHSASASGGRTACSPTNRPLEEKLTLFWHGHFATGEPRSATTG